MNGLHLIADLHDCRCQPGFLLDAPEMNRVLDGFLRAGA